MDRYERLQPEDDDPQRLLDPTICLPAAAFLHATRIVSRNGYALGVRQTRCSAGQDEDCDPRGSAVSR